MSARVEVIMAYYGSCPQCADGSTEALEEETAQAWVDDHNAENHEDAA